MYQNEILLITCEVIFILLMLSVPINLLSKNKYIVLKDLSLIDRLLINLIFLSNILLLSSIFNIQTFFILLGYVILILYLYIIKDSSIKKKNKINFSYLIIFFIIILISIDLSYELFFGWDVKWHIYFKAFHFQQNQSFANLINLPINDYPHFGGVLWSFFWKYPFNNYEYLGRISYVAIYILSIFSITEILKIDFLKSTILSILLILITYEYDLISGELDILVFSYLLIATKFTNYFFEKKYKKNNNLILFIILMIANILCWTKNEGLFFIIFLFISLILTNILEKKQIFFLIIGLFIIILFRYGSMEAIGLKHNPVHYQLDRTLNFNFNDFLYRTKLIFFYLPIYLIQNILYLIVLPILGYLILKENKDKRVKLMTLFLIMHFIFIYFVYFFKAVDIEFTIRNSMKGFLFGTLGFYIYALIIYMDKKIALINKN